MAHLPSLSSRCVLALGPSTGVISAKSEYCLLAPTPPRVYFWADRHEQAIYLFINSFIYLFTYWFILIHCVANISDTS